MTIQEWEQIRIFSDIRRQRVYHAQTLTERTSKAFVWQKEKKVRAILTLVQTTIDGSEPEVLTTIPN